MEKSSLEDILIDTWKNKGSRTTIWNITRDYFVSSEYGIKVTDGKPTIRIKNKKYKIKTISMSKNKVLKKFNKYIKELSFIPEDSLKNATISSRIDLPIDAAREFVKQLGYNRIANILPNINNYLTIKLRPHDSQESLVYRKYDLESIHLVGKAGFVKLYEYSYQ